MELDTVTTLMSDRNVAVWFNDFMLEIQFRRRYDAKKSGSNSLTNSSGIRGWARALFLVIDFDSDC